MNNLKNIKQILTLIIKKRLRYLNIYNYELIKITNTNNINGNYQICGLLSIINKFNINKVKYNIFIKKLYLKIKNLSFIYYIKIINNNFINIFIKKSWIEKKIVKMLINNKFDINNKNNIKNIVIDYSSPNISKSMHIGHLRSMISGDFFFRLSTFLGNNVYKINHIGDWGINLGSIIAIIKKYKLNVDKLNIKNLEKIYIKSKKELQDKNFKIKSNIYLNKLIKNDKDCLYIWNIIKNITLKNNKKIYKILNIKLNNNDILGESFYNKFLPIIIKDLKNKKIVFKYKNSIIVCKKILKNIKYNSKIIIRKKNEIYLYIATEIASIRYRCKYLLADKLIYYVDERQKDHLKLSFEISKKANYINKNTKFEHHSFGTILNSNKIPFKTRNINKIKLIDIINEFLIKVKNIIIEKNKNLNRSEIKRLTNTLGIGMLKYLNLSKNRYTSYILDEKNLFSLKENKLLHIQYSYIRIKSILKKYNLKNKKLNINIINKFKLCSNEELNLANILINFENLINDIYKNGQSNFLCIYLYNISILFSNYYDNNKILNNKNENNKIILIILISKIIKTGLYLLGINITNKM